MRILALSLAYLAALAFGLYQMHGPLFESRFALVQTDFADGMLNNYILEHSWQVVANRDYRGTLSSPPVFYPQPGTLWWSEHLLGAAPVYWALRLVVAPDLAYQWWQVFFAVTNFAAFALVMRWLKQPHLLAVLGGYLWAFALVHIDQLKHHQLTPRLWMPLAVYYAWVFTQAPAAKYLNRLLACVVLQSVVCMHTGWFLVAGLLAFVPFAVHLRPGGWSALWAWVRTERRAAATTTVVWGLILFGAFVPYLVVNWGTMRHYQDCFGLIPTPAAWFTGPPGNLWDSTLRPRLAIVWEECQLFCGFGVYAVMLAASVHLIVVRRSERPQLATFAAAGLLTAAVWVFLTITPFHTGPCAWFFARFIPGGTAIRCVSRVYLCVYGFGIAAALVWLGLATEQLRPWVRGLVLGAIAALIVFEQTGSDLPTYDKRDFYAVGDRVADQLRGAELGYVVPRYTDSGGTVRDLAEAEVMAMWAGQRANVPVVNGYSGRVPEKPHPRHRHADDDQLRAWLTGKFRGNLTIVDPDHPKLKRVIVIE